MVSKLMADTGSVWFRWRQTRGRRLVTWVGCKMIFHQKMRGILVDWLVEVAEEYKLVTDTLYLTVSYLDRYLSSYAVSRRKLQLLGVSCMIVASYELAYLILALFQL